MNKQEKGLFHNYVKIREINLNYFMPVCNVNRYNETTYKLQILKISYI